MISFLCRSTTNGRPSYFIAHGADKPRWGERLGKEEQIWRIPDEFAGLSIDETVGRYREWREFVLGKPA